ncbi:hypothetical protein [Aureivirga sp. CE67]|uniref:hypothetical protein n=1 Tax=Aureivirga sp. CE67 TaxID=1788983 RepID=UPI0018CBE2F9|nr:hypothetical protein [Aureivirga sp. CE67]
MKIVKNILSIIVLLITFSGKAQTDKSIIVGYDIGSFNSSIDHSGDYFKVDQNNFQSKFNIGFQLKTKSNTIYFLEYGQIYQRFSVDGTTSESRFKLDQNKFIPSTRIGIGKDISIFKKSRKQWFVYLGVGIQAEFHSTDKLTNRSGSDNDYVELTTELQDPIVIGFQPEIALKSSMTKEKSYWKLGVRYNLPFTETVSEGSFSHYLDKELVKNQKFDISGKYLSIFFQLDFNLFK